MSEFIVLTHHLLCFLAGVHRFPYKISLKHLKFKLPIICPCAVKKTLLPHLFRQSP